MYVVIYILNAQVYFLSQSLKLSFCLYNNAYQDDSGDFTTVNLDPLFGSITWPKLETLMLYGVHLSPPILSRFLAAHPSIRSLTVVEATDVSRFVKSNQFNFLDPKIPDRLSFPPNLLPNITDMFVPNYLTLSILASPISSPRHLQKLKISLSDGSFKLLQDFCSLKHLSVESATPEQLASLAAILPNIVKLSAYPVSHSVISFFYTPIIYPGS
jgi:hypothetical protein